MTHNGGGAGLGAGRWLQRDPIGTAGGLNLYQYAGGDPLRLIDPMGLRAVQYLGTDCDGNELIDDSHDGVTPEEWAQLARDSEARYANGLSDFLAGIADEVTFGGTRALRGLILGEDDGVDAQSGAYRAGEILAVVASLPYRGAASAGRSGWRYVRGLFSGADDAVKRASSAVGGRASGVSARVSARASAHGVHVSIGGAGGVSQGAAVAGGAAAGATGSAAKACGGAKGALRTRMGNPPPGMRNAQAHHDLPQAKEFQKHWARTGLDIHDPAYGRWVQGGPDGNHQKWSHAFSTEWRNFFERNSMASREEILAQLERMRRSGLYE